MTDSHGHQARRAWTPARPAPTLRSDDPAIRPMTQYTLEDFLS